MSLPRRGFLHLAASTAALPAVSRFAWAQSYPARPVRIVVGFPPGGTTDIIARMMGQWLSERLGQQFIIENRPGAGTNIGTETVVRSPADGYTLLLAMSANAIRSIFTWRDAPAASFAWSFAPGGSVSRISARFAGVR